VQFRSDFCVPGKGCVASSLDRGIAWPYQNRRRVPLVSGQPIRYSKPKVYREMRTISSFGPRSADEKVIRLDVTVNQVLLVDRLHTRDLRWTRQRRSTTRAGKTHHLPRSHAHRLDRELAPTHIEQILEAWP
jgi:hypothetical protein